MTKKKIIAMIPVRLGSKRVTNKNLRLLGNKPLVAHIIEAAKEADVFDEIFINSESEIFKEIADEYGVKFYKRPKHLSTDEATNDDFTLDFMHNVNGDMLIQLLATSPFITSTQIKEFVNKSLRYDTLISTSKVKIESIYKDTPINFNQKKQSPPSQLLEPVYAYACSLMAWQYDNYMMNMDEYGCGYHGAEGKIGFFELTGYATVDIDEEDDFLLAESILAAKPKDPQYYKPGKVFDHNVERVLAQDGVINNNLYDFNKEVTKVQDIIDSNSINESWSHTVINSKSTRSTLIGQMPGEGNRLHYHNDWDEWWYIIKGEWDWFVDGKTMSVKEGDIVFIERNKRHKITAAGTKQAIRLAVSRDDIDHIYE